MMSSGKRGQGVQRSGGRGLKRRESINIWEMTERVLSSRWSCLFLGRVGEPTGREGGKLWWNTFRRKHASFTRTRGLRQDSPSQGHPKHTNMPTVPSSALGCWLLRVRMPIVLIKDAPILILVLGIGCLLSTHTRKIQTDTTTATPVAYGWL